MWKENGRKRIKVNFSRLVVEHVPTRGVLHRGQHLHGSEPIKSGERYNLIIWMRSSSKRNQLCPMCWQKPECLIPVESDSYGDGMTNSIESS
jgi:predicted 2-oxoglutarate/Fe(II)-dependent dioxygenase YbiX